jgi:hypothetical protein
MLDMKVIYGLENYEVLEQNLKKQKKMLKKPMQKNLLLEKKTQMYFLQKNY